MALCGAVASTVSTAPCYDEMDANVVSSSIIIIANMMITKEVYEENKEVIDDII